MKIHFAGGLSYEKGGRMVRAYYGFPICCSGRKAEQIVGRGNTSDDPMEVTCERCLKALDRALRGEL
jgi:hypothetical protein